MQIARLIRQRPGHAAKPQALRCAARAAQEFRDRLDGSVLNLDGLAIERGDRAARHRDRLLIVHDRGAR